MPEIPKSPVLHAEMSDVDDSSDLESAYISNETGDGISELVPVGEQESVDADSQSDIDIGADGEDLVVSEWPAPRREASIVSIDAKSDEDNDQDASAGNG